MENGKALYNRLTMGEIDFDSLNEDDIRSVFEYLCEETEKGTNLDFKIFEKCCSFGEKYNIADAEDIIQNVYKKFESRTIQKCNKKCLLRRIFIAAAAVMTFVVTSFITASAFESDVLESVKIVWQDTVNKENKCTIEFTDHNQKKQKAVKYNNITEAFENELPEYLFPNILPSDIRWVTLTNFINGGEKHFKAEFKTRQGDIFQFIAEDSLDGKLPMGYSYTVSKNEKELDFVYTVSRKGNEITKYSFYTIYNGKKYTFYFETGDWEYVRTVLYSIEI